MKVVEMVDMVVRIFWERLKDEYVFIIFVDYG